MTEDRRPHDEDLSFDDDEFVFEGDTRELDDVGDHTVESEAALRPEDPDPGSPTVEDGGDAPFSAGEDDDLFDDEEFVIEFDDDFEELAAIEDDPAGTRSGLGSLFDAGSTAPTAADGSEVEVQEADALFDVTASGGAENEFEGVREAPEFVEDHAGWYGEDIELADMVGEEVSEAEEEVGDDTLEFEEGVDEDPFAIEDVEIESLDAAEEHDPGEVLPELEVVGDGDLEVTEAGADDGWAPLGEGDGWVMGEAPDPVEPETDEVEVPAPAFGAGRSDTFANGQLAGGDALQADAEVEQEIPVDSEWNMAGGDGVVEAEEEEGYVDPIYGDVGVGIDEVVEEEEYEGEVGLVEDGEYAEDDGEFEEAYVETSPQSAQVVGGGRVHGFPWLRAAAAMLMAISIGASAVVVLRPEWVGLATGSVGMHRVEIARPRVDLSLAAPTPEGVEQPVLDPVVDPEPSVDPEPAVDPEPTVDPEPSVDPEPTVDPEPIVDPEPMVDPEPTVDPEPVIEPTPPVEPGSRSVVAFEPLEFGEGLEIRSSIDPDEYRPAGVQDVVPGTRAFAQLRNEEIFIGVVKRVEASYVTLDLQPGEVSLQRSELSALSALATADASEITTAEHGYVRLPSEARLWGRIMRNETTDNVILRTEDGRVTIPSRDVMQMSEAAKAGTSLVNGDDSWLDRVAREKLAEFGSSTESGDPRRTTPAKPPAGR